MAGTQGDYYGEGVELRAAAVAVPDTGTCALCGRAYRGTASKPRWAFRTDGRLIGTAHVSCAQRRWRQVFAVSAVGVPLDAARFYAWSVLVLPRPELGSDRHRASILILDDSANDALTARQRESLDWWREGPMRLSPGRVAAIENAYRQLVREYRAWRATEVDDAGEQ